MKLQAKVLISSTTAIGLSLAGVAVFTEMRMQENALQEAVHRAEAVVGAAHTARDHITRLHQHGAIDMKDLLARARDEMQRNGGDYRTTSAFKAVPVVAAIEAAQGAAKAAGMDLTVTADEARNPA